MKKSIFRKSAIISAVILAASLTGCGAVDEANTASDSKLPVSASTDTSGAVSGEAVSGAAGSSAANANANTAVTAAGSNTAAGTGTGTAAGNNAQAGGSNAGTAASSGTNNGNASADEKYLADKKAAEINALDYVGAGYEVISVEQVVSSESSSNFFKVGVCPVNQPEFVAYYYVGSHHIMTESEWVGNGSDATTEFYRAKRVSEANVRSRVGMGYDIVSSFAVPNNDGEYYFKVGVAPTGQTSPVTYYYAGLNFCLTESEWLNDSSSAVEESGQNPIMNFIGSYSNGRAVMLVSGYGEKEASVKISWASSAMQTSVWTLTGTVTSSGDSVSVSYNSCRKESYTFAENGDITEDTVEYENGTGSLSFSGSSCVWNDNQEPSSADYVFEYMS